MPTAGMNGLVLRGVESLGRGVDWSRWILTIASRNRHVSHCHFILRHEIPSENMRNPMWNHVFYNLDVRGIMHETQVPGTNPGTRLDCLRHVMTLLCRGSPCQRVLWSMLLDVAVCPEVQAF